MVRQRGAPGLVMGPCIVEIDRIVISYVQYDFEVNRCRNKKVNAKNIIGTNLLTKFHEDLKINVASRVLTSKNAPPPGDHFHEDRTINVSSREKNAPPPGCHVFKATKTIFNLIQDIIGTNLRLTKFHEDWTINVASRVLTSHIRKNAPPPCGHVCKATKPIFKLTQNMIGKNLMTKFHEDRIINVASRAPPPAGGHTINVASRVRKNAPPLGSHVFQAKVTIVKLIKDFIGTNLLIMFHEDWKMNVAFRVLTRNKKCVCRKHYFAQTNQPTNRQGKNNFPHYSGGGHKNALPPGGHIFQPTGIIFKLIQDIIGMKNAPPLGSNVFQAKVTIFDLIQDIIRMNLIVQLLQMFWHNTTLTKT
ncbi:hypothetical protein DPMN_188093 [Dreissena polymorpha]|uniref:Uncharacterized protein n=1 Tax=Dreissena polymorpha TaxID=45954 RepID=A0A9D4DQ92_DREPO|nr:hypothetical protein DPMN_188093 [Dreissena polymorpha]